jgi:hypothetical protein
MGARITDCQAANLSCGSHVANAASDGSVSILDIAQPPEYSLVPSYFMGFLNQLHIQAALGVPLNFTPTSRAAVKAFSLFGDNVLYEALIDLGLALDRGIKVAFIYGDRDLACNCEQVFRDSRAATNDCNIGMAGEQMSLAIKHSHSDGFRAAGYTDLLIHGDKAGAQTRQYCSLPFTRVY